MLKTFIYREDKDVWLEGSTLLYHDLCAILDEDNKILYLWNGPKSTQKKLEKGYETVENLTANYPDASLQLTILTEDVPPEIQQHIDKMLAAIKKVDEEKKIKFSRIPSIKAYFVVLITVLGFSIVTLFILMSSGAWTSTGDGNVEIDPVLYDNWLIVARVFVVLTIISLSVGIFLGILERDSQAFIFALIGVIICIGILVLFNQGVYLFLFQEDSNDTYVIALTDLNLFTFKVFFAMLIYLLPNGYKLFTFFRDYRDYVFKKI